MKRFTDTEIYSEDWFLSLPSKYMLFVRWIYDTCDVGGVWKPNIKLFTTLTKLEVDLDEFYKMVNMDKSRFVILKNGRWFIPGFAKFQYFDRRETFKLNLNNGVHKGLLKSFLKNSISISDVLGLEGIVVGKEGNMVDDIRGTEWEADRCRTDVEQVFDRAKDKDKDKVKDKVISKNNATKNPIDQTKEGLMWEEGCKIFRETLSLTDERRLVLKKINHDKDIGAVRFITACENLAKSDFIVKSITYFSDKPFDAMNRVDLWANGGNKSGNQPKGITTGVRK